MKTGELFPATFSDKGPDLPLRMARIFTGSYDVRLIFKSLHLSHILMVEQTKSYCVTIMTCVFTFLCVLQPVVRGI